MVLPQQKLGKNGIVFLGKYFPENILCLTQSPFCLQ